MRRQLHAHDLEPDRRGELASAGGERRAVAGERHDRLPFVIAQHAVVRHEVKSPRAGQRRERRLEQVPGRRDQPFAVVAGVVIDEEGDLIIAALDQQLEHVPVELEALLGDRVQVGAVIGESVPGVANDAEQRIGVVLDRSRAAQLHALVGHVEGAGGR